MADIEQKTLYLVATPLGNLGDVTDRLVATLQACELVCAEDTRVAAKLLAAIKISGKKVISVREQNEASAARRITKLGATSVCYLSDAGTPAISDPGARLVRDLREQDFAIVPIAGPSAAAVAYSVAGMVSDGYVFAGFLPRQAKAAKERLASLASCGLPIVVYESPRRILSAIKGVGEALGPETKVCLCRELTKMHEQIVAGSAKQIGLLIDQGKIPQRGEFTYVLEPPAGSDKLQASASSLAALLAKEMAPAKAAKIAAKATGADARDLYAWLVGDRDQ